MDRISVTPRPNYQEKIEQLGFDFHAAYWKEEAYYLLRADEVEKLEQATRQAYQMMCEAARHISGAIIGRTHGNEYKRRVKIYV